MKIANLFNLVLYKQKFKEITLRQKEEKREKILNKLPLINYFNFENEFRGPKNLILERQKPYVNYFNTSKNVLDIGCGRDEFLELLKIKKIKAVGMDIDDGMINEL